MVAGFTENVDCAGGPLDDGAQLDVLPLEFEFLLRDARDIQEVVEQAGESLIMRIGGLDELHEVETVELLRFYLHKRERRDHRCQRITQLVRERRKKFVLGLVFEGEFPVGFLQLPRAGLCFVCDYPALLDESGEDEEYGSDEDNKEFVGEKLLVKGNGGGMGDDTSGHTPECGQEKCNRHNPRVQPKPYPKKNGK